MYEISRCNVRTGFENDEWIELRTGVRQGSVLSPLLFVAYLDVVIREVKEEEGLEIEVGEERISNVRIFKYLGGVFTRDGGCKQEIAERMNKYGRTVRALYPV